MSLSVDDEIQWLSKTILPEILKNGRLVDNYEESKLNTFSVGDITIKVIGIEEAFMLTQCYRATVHFEYAGEQQIRKFVVKKTPQIPPEAYVEAQFEDLFRNEITFYTEILPMIQKLSKGKFAAPRYYYSKNNPTSATVILGDFGADGWSVAKARYALSLEHAQVAVKYLGRFHGFGYAMKHDQKERFEELTKQFRESRYANDTINADWALSGKVALKRLALATNKYYPEVDNDFIRKLQKLTNSYIGYGRQRVAPREPLATFCHGDFLRNNVAFKYDTDSSGTPLETMMFDYQTLRLSSPMIDLSVFLAVSVLADVRHKHFDSLFDDYSNAVIQSFTDHSEQPLPDYLSRENLLKEYIRFLPYSLNISATFLMLLVEPPDFTVEEMFNAVITQEETIQRTMQQGGEIVDREIAHQMKELFDLSRLHNVEIDEDIDSADWADEAIFE
ncbi:uncharacterized protein LOC117569175 [Drosophila albomicans]|uniref:Uncharacterized protein LOC117569175 n=1 Tax=Drosophila albomicans TaxID=7291 RepID=A0A6P8X4G1_DROAB|nr:uncharacterized protein LOC117569175 [Drosophila albomicans]